MSDTELRKQIEDLDAEFAEVVPAPETQEELLARLEDLEDKEPEVVEEEPPPIYASGMFGLKFSHGIVRRDKDGRVIEIIEEKSRTIFHRDIAGRIIEFQKVEEVEEILADPEETEGEQ